MNEITTNNVCEIRVYSHPVFGDIRLIPNDSELSKTLYCASDIAKSMQYSRPADAISQNCRYTVKRRIPHPQSTSKSIEMLFITEGDVYRLMAHSRMPGADEFEHWLFDEVAVQINHTGMYLNMNALTVTPETAKVSRMLLTQYQNTLDAYLAECEAHEQTKAQLAIAAPKAEKHDQLMSAADGILVGDMSKLLQRNGVMWLTFPDGSRKKNGQNNFFEWLRETGYLCKVCGERRNTPKQKWVEKGIFITKVNVVEMGDFRRETVTTLITPAGQSHFLDLLCD